MRQHGDGYQWQQSLDIGGVAIIAGARLRSRRQHVSDFPWADGSGSVRRDGPPGRKQP